MGAKSCMLFFCDGDAVKVLKSAPVLDRAATTALAKSLFPTEMLQPLTDGSLLESYPSEEELYIACYPGLSIVIARDFAIDRPSELPPAYFQGATGPVVYLHAMHSVVDWFAFAIWREGKLERSLSLSPDDGVLEDIGARLPFEAPYWDGAHSADDPEELEDEDYEPYPLPFHPLDFGEVVLLNFLGFQYEGDIADFKVTPENIPLMRFKRVRGH
jgi:hypothetical protein